VITVDSQTEAGAAVLISHNFFQVVLQKSIHTQIRQLIVHISNSEGFVDGCLGELTSAKRL